MKRKKLIGFDKAKGDSIEIITRYKNDEVVFSVDHGANYYPSAREALQAYEKEIIAIKIKKSTRVYVEHLIPLIAEARSKVIKAGASPNVMYIGDIFPYKKDELPVSPMKVDTGCTIFGMRIIADYRIPSDRFYIMQGEL